MIEDWGFLEKLGSIQNIISAAVVILCVYFALIKSLANPLADSKSIGGSTTYQKITSLTSSHRFWVIILVVFVSAILIGYVITILKDKPDSTPAEETTATTTNGNTEKLKNGGDIPHSDNRIQIQFNYDGDADASLKVVGFVDSAMCGYTVIENINKGFNQIEINESDICANKKADRLDFFIAEKGKDEYTPKDIKIFN
jgi:hypothetical protein